MAAYQQPLVEPTPEDRVALEQRVLQAHCLLNRATLDLQAAKARAKAAQAAFEQAHTAWGHALYGADWDGTGLPAWDVPVAERPDVNVVDTTALVLA